jgi:conjugal transfer pilus assembly protein TraV
VTRRAALGAGAALAVISLLGGCATLGGNVKGDFSCPAPDGVCAPSHSIDDRALAMISGEAGDTFIPAGPYAEPQKGPDGRLAQVRPVAGAPAAVAPGAPRTSEKVLRIVFQPYVDGYGRLHEASAVHAVVQTGEWREQAQRDASVIPSDREMAMADPPASLSDALDRAEANLGVAGLDPNMPDPAVVAAARARRNDPIGAIKADVAARVRPPRDSHHATLPQASASPPPATRTIGAPATQGARPTPTTAASAAASPAIAAPATTPKAATPAISTAAKTGSPVEAMARVKASDAYRAAAAQAQGGAREAAASAEAPAIAPVVRATVTASAFPAAVKEDK